MVLMIPENMQLLLGGSAESMAELAQQQALALTLSDEVLEGMIESVRNGQEIQLSLGDNPAFFYDDQENQISQPSPDFEFDLFLSDTPTPSCLARLPTPAMSILNARHRNAVLRHVQPPQAKPKARPMVTKEHKKTTDNRTQIMAARQPLTKAEKEQADIDALSARFQQAEADRLENSTRILEGAVEIKGGKLKAGRGQILSRPSALPRSQPGSPALGGIGSPSLGPTSNNAAQEKVKKLRFPLIHELAVRDLTYGDLLPKWQGETEADFHTHLEKVADFKTDSQKWSLVKNYYKELDVFAYPYDNEEDRQMAIENAIRMYDKMRLPVSDAHWQKLLPVSERGKGICLSKVQAAIAKGPVAPAPKINVQSPKPSSPSLDSEREDSGSSSTNNNKNNNNTKKQQPKVGSEPMARTNSGSKAKKMSEAQAQAKRLLSNKTAKAAAPKPTSKPSSAKTSPKVSPTKPVPSKAGTGKGGRVLSKEFISDSDSDSSEEAPLSQTAAANKKVQALKDLKASTPKASTVKAGTPKPKPQPMERTTEKPKPAVEKARDVSAPKTKALPAKPSTAPKILDSIRAEGAKPMRAPKRSRDDDNDDDDSSSSGTPLSKRLKSHEHTVRKPQPSESAVKHRKSDSSQNSRVSLSSATSSSAKAKTSPVKSSPLASSPPTNASDIDVAGERDTTAVSKKRKFEPAARADKSHAADRRAERYEKNSNSSDPYDKSDSSDSSLIKRAKHGVARSNGTGISEKTREQAHRFRAFYVQYQALHKELSALDDPPEDQVHELLDMHNRLRKLKIKIQNGVAGH